MGKEQASNRVKRLAARPKRPAHYASEASIIDAKASLGRKKNQARFLLFYKTSNKPAAPMPPPMHMVTTTFLALRLLPSISAWPTSRAPVMP